MTYNGNDGHRYSGRGRGSLRVSLSSSRGARSISPEKPLTAEACYFAGLSLEDFPPIQPNGSSSTAAQSKLEHGGYGSDGIKVYYQNPHKYTGYGRGGTVARAGARSKLVRQRILSRSADDDEAEEDKPIGLYGPEGIKSSGPVVPRGGLQGGNQHTVETGPQKRDDSSLESDLEDFY